MQPRDLAETLCRRAGVAFARPLPVDRLVTACLGPRAIRVADPSTIHAHTKLVRLGNVWRIYVQRGLPRPMEVRGLLRRLVEWELAQIAYEGDDRIGLVEQGGALLEDLVDFDAGNPRRSSPRTAGAPRKAGTKRSAGARRAS